jgi:hypothetical protein
MRRFWLMNGNNEKIEMTGENILFNEASGLGYTSSEEYRRVGHRYIRYSQYYEQGSVTGSLIFYSEDPYKQYFDFIQSTSIGGLSLYYQPIEDSEYIFSRPVHLSSIDKGELDNSYGYLSTSITFSARTPWARSYSITSPKADTSKGWIWADSDQGVFPVTFGYTQAMNVSLYSKGTLESPCCLTIFGPITNPKWTHYSGSTIISTGKVTCSIKSDEKLVIDNRDDELKIQIKNLYDTVLSDVYQNSDFTTDRFITLKPGNNTIAVSGDSTESVELMLDAEVWYASV